MKERGKFIVIEGADATGKETQLALLAKRLKNNGIKIKIFDFPQYETIFGKIVGMYLSGKFGKKEDTSPYLAALPYSGDRWLAKPKINESLLRGDTVLSNRYFFSNLAHQAARLPLKNRDEFISVIEELEYGVYGIPREDLNVVLNVPPEVSRELIKQKKKRSYLEDKKKDIHEEDLEYQIEVAELYRDLPARYPNVVGIDCTQEGKLMSVDEIHSLIWIEVSRCLEITKEGSIIRERQR